MSLDFLSCLTLDNKLLSIYRTTAEKYDHDLNLARNSAPPEAAKKCPNPDQPFEIVFDQNRPIGVAKLEQKNVWWGMG